MKAKNFLIFVLGALVFLVLIKNTVTEAVRNAQYEEVCIDPSQEEIESAKKLNDSIRTATGVKFKPEPKCELRKIQ